MSERDQRAHRHVERPRLVGAAEVGQIDNNAGSRNLGTHLAQKLDRTFRALATSRRQQVRTRTQRMVNRPPAAL
jgi:hypothetical protein